MDKRWWYAREREKDWHPSISSLSEWQGWVPFSFLVVRYWNEWLCHCWHHQNISSDASGNLPLHCVPSIISSRHQGPLIPDAGLQGCFQCMNTTNWEKKKKGRKFLLFYCQGNCPRAFCVGGYSLWKSVVTGHLWPLSTGHVTNVDKKLNFKSCFVLI